MIPAPETEHEAKGLDLLIDQYRGKPVITGILKAYLQRIQRLEDDAWDVIFSKIQDNAYGVGLDQFGEIVGETRRGRADVDYLPAIRLKIRVNRSRGRTQDLVDVALLASVNDAGVVYRETYPAGWELDLYDVPGIRYVVELLGKTKATSTAGQVIYTPGPRAGYAVWGSIYDVAAPVAFTSIYSTPSGSDPLFSSVLYA